MRRALVYYSRTNLEDKDLPLLVFPEQKQPPVILGSFLQRLADLLFHISLFKPMQR